MIEKQLSIGISDYKKIIENNNYYVDKTLLIKEILEKASEVILIPRPRRFGKTLNISMLRYFFEKTNESNAHLFINTEIWQYELIKLQQGQFPVIYLTFKDVKSSNWSDAYNQIKNLIRNEFSRHESTISSGLSEFQLKFYKKILNDDATKADFSNSLLFLSELLYNHYQKKVIFLLDEYDAPINAAYSNGFYDDMVKFMSSFLPAVLKDNRFLERGILTGILFLAKAGIFSGLNNLDVFNTTDSAFEDKFGFTELEVKKLLNDYEQNALYEDLKNWYNGYTFGKLKGIYNPWSVIQCVEKKGELKLYWVNTSENLLIKEILAKASRAVKSELESILQNHDITKTIEDSVILPELEFNGDVIWSLLFYSGYLTYDSCRLISGKKVCSLKIPNNEIRQLYFDLIKLIFTQSITKGQTSELLKAIIDGDVFVFQELLQNFIINSMSVYDIPVTEAERSYHLFVLGLLVALSDQYEIKSNRESGYGRYDIMLIPKQKNKIGIVIEFKKVIPGETLETAAQKALEQIENKNYAQELISKSVKEILKYGVAFEGKKVFVKLAKN